MMKYLYLIIRHVFPRKRWECIGNTDVMGSNGIPICVILTLQDQFGNIKLKKIKN